MSPVDLANCKRDATHFFEDVYFIVGDIIFRVPRHHFEDESPKFKEMFGLPGTPEPPSSKGTLMKENPMHRLPNVDVDEFRQFLRVMYPRRFNDEKLDVKQWIAVLKLSTTWGFDKVRELAIKHLEETRLTGIKGGFDLLILSRTYEVKRWLLPALRLLAEKNEFKEEFVEKLTLPVSIKVVQMQGLVAGYRLQRAPGGKGPKEITQAELDILIKKVFTEVEIPKENGTGNGEAGTAGGAANGSR